MEELITIQVGFTLDSQNFISGTLKEGATQYPILFSGTFFSFVSGTVNGVHYSDLYDTLAQKLNDASANTYSVTFDASSGVTQISSSYSGFEFEWFSEHSAKHFGFNSAGNYEASAYALEEVNFPLKVWREPGDSRTKWMREYEPESIGKTHYADDGTPYGIRKSGSADWSDWEFEAIDKERCWRRDALSSHPYTLEDVVKHCRNTIPFVLHTGSIVYTWENKEACYIFRDELGWKPKELFPNYHDHMVVEMKVQHLD